MWNLKVVLLISLTHVKQCHLVLHISPKIGMLKVLSKLLSVSENIVLTTHKDISHHTFINNRLLQTSVEDGVRQLSIKVSNVDDAVGFLSGGNQQKVVFANY